MMKARPALMLLIGLGLAACSRSGGQSAPDAAGNSGTGGSSGSGGATGSGGLSGP
jgi:hypothetical protein